MYSAVWVSTQLNICLFLKDEIQAYGIDIDGPVPDDHGDDINVVEVPNTLNPLQQTHYQEMLAAIDPLRPSDCHGTCGHMITHIDLICTLNQHHTHPPPEKKRSTYFTVKRLQ